METKTCTKCKIQKEINDINFRKRSKDKWRAECKKCNDIFHKEYYIKNKKQILNYHIEYENKNKKIICEKRKNIILKIKIILTL
jgi:hypothetical protein